MKRVVDDQLAGDRRARGHRRRPGRARGLALAS